MDKTNNLLTKINQKQKMAIGIFLTIIFFIIAYAIAREITSRPFSRINDTWFAWSVFTIFTGFLWYKVFETHEENNIK